MSTLDIFIKIFLSLIYAFLAVVGVCFFVHYFKKVKSKRGIPIGYISDNSDLYGRDDVLTAPSYVNNHHFISLFPFFIYILLNLYIIR